MAVGVGGGKRLSGTSVISMVSSVSPKKSGWTSGSRSRSSKAERKAAEEEHDHDHDHDHEGHDHDHDHDHDEAVALAETVEDEGIVDTEAAVLAQEPVDEADDDAGADESVDDEKKDS